MVCLFIRLPLLWASRPQKTNKKANPNFFPLFLSVWHTVENHHHDIPMYHLLFIYCHLYIVIYNRNL